MKQHDTIWPYPIDWHATASWMQAFAGFAAAAAVVYAAHRGSASFQQWLKQRQIERKLAAGERILTLVYRAKDAFPAIRSPLHLAYELAAAEEKLKVLPGYTDRSDGQRSRLQTAQVVLDRLGSYSKVWDEIFECLPIARAFFGPEMEEQLRIVLKQLRQLQVSAQMYASHGDRHDDFSAKLNRDIWAGMADSEGKSDEISASITAVVKHCEARILPVISSDFLAPPEIK